MTLSEKLYQTIKDFPESLITEVLDFAEFLKKKDSPRRLKMIAASSSRMELLGFPGIPCVVS
jgi:hypothetical protein